MTEPDFIMAGAGHNSLVAAAYLARAVLCVLVEDGRAVGVRTREGSEYRAGRGIVSLSRARKRDQAKRST